MCVDACCVDSNELQVAAYVTVVCTMISLNMCFMYSWAIVSKANLINTDLAGKMAVTNKMADKAWKVKPLFEENDIKSNL